MPVTAKHRDLARQAYARIFDDVLSGDPARGAAAFAEPGILPRLIAPIRGDGDMFTVLTQSTQAFLPQFAKAAVRRVVPNPAAAFPALLAGVSAPGAPWVGTVPVEDLEFATRAACGVDTTGPTATRRGTDAFVAVIATCLHSVREPGFDWRSFFDIEWTLCVANLYAGQADVRVANSIRAAGPRQVIARHLELRAAIAERGDVLAFRHALTVAENRNPNFAEAFDYLNGNLGTVSVQRLGAGAESLADILTAPDGSLAGAPREAVLLTLTYLDGSVVKPGAPVDVLLAATAMMALGFTQPGFGARHEDASRGAFARLGVSIER